MERLVKDVSDQERSTTLNNYRGLLLRMMLPDKALDCYTEVLKLQDRACAENHPEIGRTYTNISACYLIKRDHAKAKEYADKADMIKSRSMLNNYHSVALTKENLGMAQKNLGDSDGAYDNLEKAEEILQQNCQPGDEHVKAIGKEKSSIQF